MSFTKGIVEHSSFDYLKEREEETMIFDDHMNKSYSFVEFIAIQELPPIWEVNTVVWELDK